MEESHSLDKAYYRIGEVADLLQVNTSLIRFWERELPFLQARKTGSGKRRYTPEDISQLRLVHYLVKEKGYTLRGAKTELTKSRGKIKEKLVLLDDLKALRDFLMSLREELKGSL